MEFPDWKTTLFVIGMITVLSAAVVRLIIYATPLQIQ